MATSTDNIPEEKAPQLILDSAPKRVEMPEGIKGDTKEYLERYHAEHTKWCNQAERALRIVQKELGETKLRLQKLEGKT